MSDPNNPNSGQPQQKPLAEQAAEALDMMSKRIRSNHPDDFSGVFVIIPPEGSGAEMLILDARKDAATFWSMLKTHCEIAIEELTSGAGIRATTQNTRQSWRNR